MRSVETLLRLKTINDALCSYEWRNAVWQADGVTDDEKQAVIAYWYAIIEEDDRVMRRVYKRMAGI